jgi:Flp pilus assembly protein TadG
MVEFVLVLLVFLTLLFGLLNFGLALYVFNYVAFAAREGTRYAMIRGSDCTTFATDCPTLLSGSGVLTYLETVNVPPGISPGKMTVTTSWPGTNPGCVLPANSPGCVVKVVVTYSFNFWVPLMPASTTIMSSTSQMVISQ